MGTAMTPSKEMTRRQIDKAVANYRALLEKHAPEFASATVQVVLGQPELAREQFAVLRARVEAQGEIIIRRVRVDRTRTPMEAINATGCNKYVDDDVVVTMPQGEGDEVDVYFIPTRRFIPVAEVPAFLAQYGLVPDPRAQAAVNEADPTFADKYSNGTQWGENCCLTFRRCDDDERRVRCGRSGGGWNDNWFLSGVPAPRK